MWTLEIPMTTGRSKAVKVSFYGNRAMATHKLATWTCILACFLTPVTVKAQLQEAGSAAFLPEAGQPVPPQNASTAAALPADQLVELLREKPELMIDLKKLASEQLQAQGIAVQEDSITDEMLLGKIVSDASLRANVTLWLRARGYISTMSTRPSASAALTDDEDEDQALLPRTPVPTDFEATQALGPRADLIQDGTRAGPGAGTDLASLEAMREINSERMQPQQARRDKVSKPRSVTEAAPPSGTAEVLHSPTPLNLLAMRDLYTQVPDQGSSLKRFASDFFLSHGMAGKQPSIDLPVGPDYVIGPGDGINIDVWGGLSQQFTRIVDREGRVALPEAGPVVIAGLTLADAQKVIGNAMLSEFRDAKVEVSVTRLRTVRIYVVGDVQRPGAYDVSSLSTPLNALYAAGGPTAIGSLRTVRHYRGKELIREVDLYDFILHGVRTDSERLQSGDTILVPPVGSQVTIAGMVRRPAIYELRNETNLAEVLALAGGVLVSADMRDIKVERIQAHDKRVTLRVDVPEGSGPATYRKAVESFVVEDGDHVMVDPILPYSERAVYVDGHVVRPGKYPYRDNMSLSDVIHSYQDVLPEPAGQGEIIRLRPPDYRPETIEFDLAQVLIGNDPVMLQPFDTIRIFGRYEVDAPTVTIRGEVRRPGKYPLPEDMTAAQLVRMAGGFKRSALLDAADLASYEIKDGEKVVSRRVTVNIGRAVNEDDSTADVVLKAGDILTIHQLSGWNDIGASVTLKGEVTYPGMYGIQDGEKLSSVLKRAGGFAASAYPAGAVLVRKQVREIEEKSRDELVKQLETASAGTKISPGLNLQEQTGILQLVVAQQQQVVQRLKSQAPTGRLVIKINADIASWEHTPADIELRSGDVLTVPKRPGFVLVSGQVYNAAAITYVPGKTAGWYLRHAGGSTSMADNKEIFVIRANGSVVGRHSGEWYTDGVLDTKMQPGDVVVVPQKILGGSMFWRNMLATAQVLSSIAITAHVAGAL